MAVGGKLEPVNLSYDESIFSVYHEYCKLCKSRLVHPHVLSCLHIFCEQCLIYLFCHDVTYLQNNDYQLRCPDCKKMVTVGLSGFRSLLTPTTTISGDRVDLCSFDCSSCGTGTSSLFRCQYCSKLLCRSCSSDHSLVDCSTGSSQVKSKRRKLKVCYEHNKLLKYYCFKCEIAACVFCLAQSHHDGEHVYDLIVNAEKNLRSDIQSLLSKAKDELSNYNSTMSDVLKTLTKLQCQHDIEKDKVESNYQSYIKFTDKCRSNALKVLDDLFLQREIDVRSVLNKVEGFRKNINESCRNTEKLLMEADNVELLNLRQFISSQFTDLNDIPHISTSSMESSNKEMHDMVQEVLTQFHEKMSTKRQLIFGTNESGSSSSTQIEPEENGISCSEPIRDHPLIMSYGRWGEKGQITVIRHVVSIVKHRANPEGISKIGVAHKTSLMDDPLQSYHPESSVPYNESISGSTMSIRVKCKIGSMGVSNGQFNYPQGFCIGANDEILVADTNNHRIQVFRANGSFKFKFGNPGKEEECLWFPRKIAAMKKSHKRIVVNDRGVERTRFQIFSEHGAFLRKIPFFDIGLVASLEITDEGYIVIVDSTIASVHIINEFGDLIRHFDCRSYIIEPSDMTVNGTEFFICDYKAHRVAVFNESGVFQRYIGNKDLLRYPNGIDISSVGDIFVSDSDNNRFHLCQFKRDGTFVMAYACEGLKISRCCGLRLNSYEDLITISRNNSTILIVDNNTTI